MGNNKTSGNGSVIRVFKTKDFTVMSNYHFRDKNISLKAKGLLSEMFTLTEDWHYSIAGLAAINKEGVDAIKATLKELEDNGYITRHRIRDEKGRLSGTEYCVYERPIDVAERTGKKGADVKAEAETASKKELNKSLTDTPAPTKSDKPVVEKPKVENPLVENPHMEKPHTEKPHTEKPYAENPRQYNNLYIKQSNNKTINKSNNLSIKHTEGKIDGKIDSTPDVYRDQVLAFIKNNIEYDLLKQTEDNKLLDEILDIITDTILYSDKEIKISGNNYPAEVVISQFKKLDFENIQAVIAALEKNNQRIRNIRNYIISMLYNVRITNNAQITAQVAYDLGGI